MAALGLSAAPDTSDAAVALGIANQLTNILRDVGETKLVVASTSHRKIFNASGTARMT